MTRIIHATRSTASLKPNWWSTCYNSSTPPSEGISPPWKLTSTWRLLQTGNSSVSWVQFVTGKSSSLFNLGNWIIKVYKRFCLSIGEIFELTAIAVEWILGRCDPPRTINPVFSWVQIWLASWWNPKPVDVPHRVDDSYIEHASPNYSEYWCSFPHLEFEFHMGNKTEFLGWWAPEFAHVVCR